MKVYVVYRNNSIFLITVSKIAAKKMQKRQKLELGMNGAMDDRVFIKKLNVEGLT